MSSAAPGDLELLRQFVNTVDPDEHTDALDTPEHLGAWLSDRGLLATGTHVASEDHTRALRFRECVRDLALGNSGPAPDPQAILSFNELAEPTRLVLQLGGDGSAALVAEGSDLDHVLGRLLASVFVAMTDGSWQRLKACSNDTCRWLYFDHSKNRSKKWCTMESCGNVINARAYRERRREV